MYKAQRNSEQNTNTHKVAIKPVTTNTNDGVVISICGHNGAELLFLAITLIFLCQAVVDFHFLSCVFSLHSLLFLVVSAKCIYFLCNVRNEFLAQVGHNNLKKKK